MPQVSAKLTQSDAATVAGAMIWAYKVVLGRDPVSNASWAMPTAQSAIETDHWRQLYNWNAGNVTSGHPNAQDWYENPHVTGGLRFRAFPTLGQGCVAMVHWLSSRGCIEFADAGDESGFIGALEASGYGTPGQPYPAIGVSQYYGIQPIAYWELSRPAALGIGFLIVAAAGATAYWIVEGEKQLRFGRGLPRRQLRAIGAR